METRRILPAVCLGLAALVAFPAAQADRDDDDDARDNSAMLVGTWRFTGFDPVIGEFYDYLIFHEGGTLTEKVAFTNDSHGSGVWEEVRENKRAEKREDGQPNRHRRRGKDDVADFRAMFESFHDSDVDGIYDARTRVRITFQVSGNQLSGTGTIEFRTLEDNELLGPPLEGSTFVATRMQVIPQ